MGENRHDDLMVLLLKDHIDWTMIDEDRMMSMVRAHQNDLDDYRLVMLADMAVVDKLNYYWCSVLDSDYVVKMLEQCMVLLVFSMKYHLFEEYRLRLHND